jgi:precorrin-3B C17-methyltransferase
MNCGKLFVVGIGPGNAEQITAYAQYILMNCDVICGYITYINQLPSVLLKKGINIFEYGMGEEIKRVQDAIKYIENGKNVALISGGDASLYGLASLVYEIIDDTSKVEVVPGITAILARLGSPISEDIILISLSDLLIPWEIIEKRIKAY